MSSSVYLLGVRHHLSINYKFDSSYLRLYSAMPSISLAHNMSYNVEYFCLKLVHNSIIEERS